MERKIGEIFEYNGEWYQCVKQPKEFDDTVCNLCAMSKIKGCEIDECSGQYRTDRESVIFKKLEKVGNPYEYNGKTWQPYKSPIPIEIIPSNLMYKTVRYDFIEIEIKQNQENIEENKLNLKEFDIEAAKAGKPVCTRDGGKARIICFDKKCRAIEGDLSWLYYMMNVVNVRLSSIILNMVKAELMANHQLLTS